MNRIFGILIALLLVFSIVFSTSCQITFPETTPSGDNTVTDGDDLNDDLSDNESDGGSEDDNVSDEGGSDTETDDETSGGSNGDQTNNGTNESDGEDPSQDDNTSADDSQQTIENPALTKPSLSLDSIPKNDGKGYVELNNNQPYFTKNQIVSVSYEHYSALDSLGRCGLAVACLGKDLMPSGSRGSLSTSPSGWHAKAIYERSHLIAFALAGEEDNKNNLITGTYDLNGIMQEFEALVLDYIKETNNHVMYRVDPIFEGNDLVCRGVQMEAYSVEDNGEGICFNIFVYNDQDDVVIDYATGDYSIPESQYTYILHKTKHKIHKTTCNAVHDMKEENKEGTTLTLEELVAELTRLYGSNWSYCGTCKPQNG